MNTVVTSKEQILQTSRELIRQQGWSTVSIRSVAAACGVSVGSIYNYFDSKAELVGATVESVWCEIFHRPDDEAVFRDTEACVTWMYECMEYGCRQYPGFFREKGEVMNQVRRKSMNKKYYRREQNRHAI